MSYVFAVAAAANIRLSVAGGGLLSRSRSYVSSAGSGCQCYTTATLYIQLVSDTWLYYLLSFVALFFSFFLSLSFFYDNIIARPGTSQMYRQKVMATISYLVYFFAGTAVIYIYIKAIPLNGKRR